MPAKLLRGLLLAVALLAVRSESGILAGLRGGQRERAPWQESPTSVFKGRQTRVPRSIRRELSESIEDCPYLSDSTRMNAYRLRSGRTNLLSVHARNLCFCGATGNCAFWIYRKERAQYSRILETDMVQDFGFLAESHHGLPDLVIWSHDSATRTPGAWWRFDGQQYSAICSWQLVWERELANGETEVTSEPQVENNSCTEILSSTAEP